MRYEREINSKLYYYLAYFKLLHLQYHLKYL